MNTTRCEGAVNRFIRSAGLASLAWLLGVSVVNAQEARASDLAPITFDTAANAAGVKAPVAHLSKLEYPQRARVPGRVAGEIALGELTRRQWTQTPLAVQDGGRTLFVSLIAIRGAQEVSHCFGDGTYQPQPDCRSSYPTNYFFVLFAEGLGQGLYHTQYMGAALQPGGWSWTEVTVEERIQVGPVAYTLTSSDCKDHADNCRLTVQGPSGRPLFSMRRDEVAEATRTSGPRVELYKKPVRIFYLSGIDEDIWDDSYHAETGTVGRWVESAGRRVWREVKVRTGDAVVLAGAGWQRMTYRSELPPGQLAVLDTPDGAVGLELSGDTLRLIEVAQDRQESSSIGLPKK